jgi:ATP phosphoribosyltransferase
MFDLTAPKFIPVAHNSAGDFEDMNSNVCNSYNEAAQNNMLNIMAKISNSLEELVVVQNLLVDSHGEELESIATSLEEVANAQEEAMITQERLTEIQERIADAQEALLESTQEAQEKAAESLELVKPLLHLLPKS